jgi:uncharacterized oligopeptide transporter (OPT) family protein
MALISVGHLVGVAVRAAMVIGMLITWAHRPALDPGHRVRSADRGDLETQISAAFKQKARMAAARSASRRSDLLKIIGPIAGVARR